jgi:hypothetical protein
MAPRNAQKQADVPAFILELVKLLRQAKLANNAAHVPDDWAANKQRRLAELERYVNHQIQINLGSWKEEVDQAINHAQYPIQPESRIFWYIALAGNLLWVATSLISPPVAAAASQYMRRFVGRSDAGRQSFGTDHSAREQCISPGKPEKIAQRNHLPQQHRKRT